MYKDMMDTIGMVNAADPELGAAMERELTRQRENIELIASENIVSPAVMAAMGSVLTNKYAEGLPGKRYYGGCVYVDEVENIAIQRACQLFGAKYANVQPHSGAQANLAVYFALLELGDTVMGMDLSQGGHLTHGSPVNMSGKNYHFISYGVGADGVIDYAELEKQVRKVRPKMLVAGASAYPRAIDFEKLAEIAHGYGAYLMVDMAHIAGLVAGGQHQSPVPYADVVTTTTHKTLRGPRGGLILTNNPIIAKRINSAVFPARGKACIRRHRQPPDAHRPAGRGVHRQGPGAALGQRAHHRQQEHRPRRDPQPLCDLRRASGHPGCHHPRHGRSRDAGDRGLHCRLHLALCGKEGRDQRARSAPDPGVPAVPVKATCK